MIVTDELGEFRARLLRDIELALVDARVPTKTIGPGMDYSCRSPVGP